MRLLFIDTETGGLYPEKHSLLSIALAGYEDGKILFQEEYLVSKEHYDVIPAAIEYNNIDLNYLRDNGLSEEKIIDNIENLRQTYFPDELPVVIGHNVEFDLRFLKALYSRFNLDFYERFSYGSIDTKGTLFYLSESGLIKEKISKLDEAIKYFNLDINKSKRHTALEDVLITIKLHEKILQLLGGNHE